MTARSALQRFGVLALCVFCAACGSSSPTAPAPATPTPTPTPTPVVANVTVAACPAAIVGFTLDLGFYQEIGCNAFEGPTTVVRRWTVAPKIYIRTVDEAGATIDAATLQTVQDAMSNTASTLTGGKFGLASIERGTDTRQGVSGYVTVKWLTTTDRCGAADVAVDGGTIEFSPQRSQCACSGSRIYARAAAHELGHALGYWHTDNVNDLMYGQGALSCTPSLSARELAAAAYQYR